MRGRSPLGNATGSETAGAGTLDTPFEFGVAGVNSFRGAGTSVAGRVGGACRSFPLIVFGISQAPENLGWIIVVIYGVSFIQRQVVTLILVAGSIRLPLVLVLLGQIVAGAFLGFLGLMLAVPITAIIMILVQEVYIKDMLGDLSVNETLAAPDEALLPDGV